MARKFLILLGALFPLAFLFYPATWALISCTPDAMVRPAPSPVPTYSGLYSFARYKIPESARPGSVNLTAVIIVPEYKDTLSQEYAGGARVRAGGSITPDMLKVFKSFAGSLGEDIEAQLVAKGMTTKGPFALPEVTYPDKKAADLTISTHTIFDINYSKPGSPKEVSFDGGSQGDVRANVYAAHMAVGIKVFYYILEPMSEEKMWIKKLDLGVQEYPYEYALKIEQYVSGGGDCEGPSYSFRSTEEYVYDERPKIFSDILKTAYPQIMNAAWNYLDASEMLALKSKAQEIREKKRY